MKIIIATGGTGGHIYPAIALADAAKQRYKDVDILFIGNDDRMERVEVPAHGYAFEGIHASGLTGSLWDKAKAVLQLCMARSKARKILMREAVDVVIGFGGYVSAPVLLAAHSLGIKTMIHEQNSIVGKANLMLAKKVDGIVTCYEKCNAQLPLNKVRLLGNPRSSLALQHHADDSFLENMNVPTNKPLVLIVMGSLGSSSVNDIMKDALQGMEDVTFLYVSGKKNYNSVKSQFTQSNVYVVEYVDQLALMKRIDLLICRAGATTAAEITALGVPTILIPSPYVANNHQFYNASVLVDKKCAFMIEEKNLNKDVLYDKINMVIHNRQLMKEMKENALAISYPKASEDILDYMEEIVG